MGIQRMRALSTTVDAGLSYAFGSLAEVITNRPITTIIATLCLAFALGPGMGMSKSQLNGEKLWTPQDTESKDQQEWVMATFGMAERRVQAYSTNKGANLLSQDSLVALEQLHNGALSVTAACETGSCDGKTIAFQDVRAKQRYSVLSIWGDKAPPAGTDILADLNDKSKWMATGGAKLKLSDMLGGVAYDSAGKIISAEAFLTTFWLKNERESVDSTETDPWSEAWELEFDDYVRGFSNAALNKNYPWTMKGQSEAGGSAIKGDVGLLSFGYMALIIFSIIVLSNHKRVQSNGCMAMASVFSVGLSIVSTFGFCGYVGVKQNPVTSVLYLVLLGIGVDDAYVIMGEYGHSKGTPKERVVQALTKAGTSIAVTSVTDMVAFAAGISSTLPALRDFCIFAAIGILFDFFYQCTFLVAVLMLRARCSEDGRPDWLCCMHVDPESTGCCGCSLPVCSRDGKHVCCPCSWDNGEGDSDSVTRNVLNRITKFTLTPVGSVTVLVVTLATLAGAVAGIPSLHSDFDIEWFTPDEHEYKDTFEVRNKYFATTGSGLPVYIYTKSGNYGTAHSDGSLSALYDRVGTCSWIDSNIGNWYTEFVKDAGRRDRSKASEAAFVSEVNSFVMSPAGARYIKDIVFATNEFGAASAIRGSRALYLTKESESGSDDIAMTEAVRDCTDEKPLDAFPFQYAFLYFDGLAVVDKETIQNVLIACLCVFLVNLVMLADLLAAILVLGMIALCDVCILGYMAHWDLNFNSVTAINLVLAVGLAVDYSAHIAHSFLVIRGSGLERAKQAVDHIGKDVFNGAFSTFLAILPLSMSKSYVFRVFFKMWFMIIVFGIFFGVIVLPVLLSVAGRFIGAEQSEIYNGETKDEASKNTKVEPEAIKNECNTEDGLGDIPTEAKPSKDDIKNTEPTVLQAMTVGSKHEQYIPTALPDINVKGGTANATE